MSGTQRGRTRGAYAQRGRTMASRAPVTARVDRRPQIAERRRAYRIGAPPGVALIRYAELLAKALGGQPRRNDAAQEFAVVEVVGVEPIGERGHAHHVVRL